MSSPRLVSWVDRVVMPAGDLGPALLGGVEVGDPGAEGARVPADLVQPDEPGVAVVRGVLDTLGHDRAGQLLEPDAQLVGRVGQPGE